MCKFELRYLERSWTYKSNNKLVENDFRKLTNIFVSETWGAPDQDIRLKGYDIHLFNRESKHPRANRYSGGIALLIKESVSSKVEIYKSHKDLYVCANIKCVDHHLFVSFMYIPPNKLENNQADETVFDMLVKDQALISSQFSDVAFAACGNMNLRTGEEDDFVPGDGAKYNYLADEYDPDVAIKRYSKDKTLFQNWQVAVKLLSGIWHANIKWSHGRSWSR